MTILSQVKRIVPKDDTGIHWEGMTLRVDMEGTHTVEGREDEPGLGWLGQGREREMEDGWVGREHADRSQVRLSHDEVAGDGNKGQEVGRRGHTRLVCCRRKTTLLFSTSSEENYIFRLLQTRRTQGVGSAHRHEGKRIVECMEGLCNKSS